MTKAICLVPYINIKLAFLLRVKACANDGQFLAYFFVLQNRSLSLIPLVFNNAHSGSKVLRTKSPPNNQGHIQKTGLEKVRGSLQIYRTNVTRRSNAHSELLSALCARE